MKINISAMLAAPVFRRVRRYVISRVTLTPAGYRAQSIVAALLLVIAGGAGAQAVTKSMDALPNDAAFRAAGVVMTKQQMQHRVNVMEFLYGLQPPKDSKQMDQFNRSVAKALAVSDVVDTSARERGIVIADKAASDQLDKMIQDNGVKDRSTFIQQIGARGVSEQDVIDEIKRQQANARLFAQITQVVKPSTDGDAQNYYNQHQAQMVSPEQRDIMNIVVPTPDQAQQIVQLAQNTNDFGALAKQFSIDGSTKDNGGSLGLVQADQLDPGYSKAAFSAPPGSVFGPVQTSQGWNIGRVNDVHPSVPMSFPQVKDAIKTKLDNDAKLKVWDDFLGQRIKAAKVVYAPEYQPADPDAPPAVGATG